MRRALSIGVGLLTAALAVGPALAQEPQAPAQSSGLELEIRTLNNTALGPLAALTATPVKRARR